MNPPETLVSALRGRYDVDREIGAGGMATVYLAHDPRHDRPVAIKVLNPELGAVLGVERFLAEIRVTANLQHPNLLPLFDSGEAGGLLFYVMPYVEGETLRVRLDREKQLPIDEAIRISVAVANALDYAHSHNVIHRDLKPENILMQAGQPVIADFGIALAVSKAGGNRITQTGLSLGTPQYMSPEQATGDRLVDGRSDIYSLAAMTYEMLSGEPPHTGSTAQAVIARMLTDRPRSIRASRPSVPEYVEATLERALEKLPADRFATAHEFAESLLGRGIGATNPTTMRTAAARAREARDWRSRLRDPLTMGLVALTVLAFTMAAFAMARRSTGVVVTRPIRFVVAAPDSVKPIDNFPWPAAISPDGGTLVYSVNKGAAGELYALRTDQLDAHPIPGTTSGFQPLFSPDGAWLEFEVNGKEKKVRFDGSAPITISDGGGANGADWTTRDEIILGAQGKMHGLSRVSAAGGEPVAFTHPDSAKGEADHIWPIALADGKTIVFTVWYGTLATSRLAMTSLDDGHVVPLDIKGIRPLAVVDDALIWVQADGAVMAAQIDAGRKHIVGKPVPVLDPVLVTSGLNGNSGIFVSRGGALTTSRGGTKSKLAWLEHDGSFRNISSEARGYTQPRLSPDGRRFAVVVGDAQQTDIWIYEIATGTLSRLSSIESAASPEWTSDGKRVVFTAVGTGALPGIWSQAADGGSAAEKLVESPDVISEVAISPDSRSVVYTAFRENVWKTYRVDLSSPKVAHPYIGSASYNVFGTRFSPTGKWTAIMSGESGTGEVYVRSFPDPGARVQISVGGGSQPVWSADGKRLYYRSGSALLVARLEIAGGVRVLGRDTVMLKGNASPPGFLHADYDVTRDGSRFLMLATNKDDYQLVVVPNWIAELRQRLSGALRK